jgi:4-amino-4-deoxychorismate lyase
MSEMSGSWIDGVPGASVPLDDRGLQYGDGLFETMLLREGRVRFLEAHLARLAAGCARLGISLNGLAPLRAEIAAAAKVAPPLAILKLIVTRGSGPRRGYAATDCAPRRLLTLFTAPAAVDAAGEGVAARLATLRLGENPALAGLKHLNRLENVLAASEPEHATVFESLLLDAAGHLVGGTMSNVFAVRDGRVLTPPVDRCGVAGVLRGIVRRECAALGIGFEERRFRLGELLAADEVFVTNARIGVVCLRRVGEHHFSMNEVASRLARHIEVLDA